MSMLKWAYVRCKNPDCGSEFSAPFATAVRVSFNSAVEREVACPFCRASALYTGSDFHRPHEEVVAEAVDLTA